MQNNYLASAIQQFEYYKLLGDKTLSLLPDDKLIWQYNDESNSIASIVKHLNGNMLSRWTDFLNSDGEKTWRKRDDEFENEKLDKASVLKLWNDGWTCLFNTLNDLTINDLDKIIYIRNQGHTVTEAINRQLAHYPYHIGQIIFIGKMLLNENWQSLSIPRNNSNQYNENKFAQAKQIKHFTTEYLNPKKENE
jgi:hypothetical protein